MSEEKPKYLEEALEMIGIDLSKPKQIIQEVSGFTPLFDAVVQQYKDETRAAVHGAMWRFCQMEDGVCKASLSTIADMLGISPATVMRHAEALCEDGYFTDLTPDLKNRPHVYADTGKVVMKSKLNAGISQRNVGISQRNAGISESQLNKVLNKDIEEKPKGDLVDLELSKLPSISIRKAIQDYFKLNVNWETKTARQWLEWAHRENITAEQIAHAADTWRFDKQFNWQVPTLKGIFEKWQMLMDASRQPEERKESSGYYA